MRFNRYLLFSPLRPARAECRIALRQATSAHVNPSPFSGRQRPLWRPSMPRNAPRNVRGSSWAGIDALRASGPSPEPHLKRPCSMSRRILLALAWTVLVLVLCWIPGRWLGREGPGGQSDKLAHAGMFVVFSWLWAWAVAPSMRTARILGAGLLLALVTEVGQAVPLIGRDPDPFDALADSIGACVGLGVFRLRNPVPEPSEPASVAE